MKKSKDVKKELIDINKKIEQLRSKKKKSMRKNDMVFCRVCNKFYSRNKCRQGPIMSDGFLEEWQITCPKGHKWDDK